MTAFEELVYRYDKYVLNIAKSFRNDNDDSKDIYQEVFLRVYRGIKNFQFKSEFSTWLYRIAVNVCISYQSKKKNFDSIDKEIKHSDDDFTLGELISSDNKTDSLAIGSDLSKHINKVLNTLSPKQRMVFTLKFYQEYKIKEIADIMQCTEGTIKRYLFNATNKMREGLKNIL